MEVQYFDALIMFGSRPFPWFCGRGILVTREPPIRAFRGRGKIPNEEATDASGRATARQLTTADFDSSDGSGC